jgi:hypothetical protein
MNDQPASAEEQDDAAFRARLAPLASEVLPPPPSFESPRSPSGSPPGSGRRPAVMMSRARAALPASEVAPVSPSIGPAPAGIRNWHWATLVLAVLAAAVLGVASLQSRWPWSAVPASVAPPSAAPPSVAGVAPPAAAPMRPVVRDTAPSPANASAAMIGLLVERGEAALADGDIIAARLLFERAAGLGSAAAATRAGETYDIDFLLRAGTRGIRADGAAAAGWYRKAAALGDPEARARLAHIEGRTRP